MSGANDDTGAIMETRPETTIVDLAALERQLAQRAWWHEDPEAYRQGVRDVLEVLQDRSAGSDPRTRRSLAG